MHLAHAFIQSDLQCIQIIHFFVSMSSLGIEPTTFALLMQCSNHWATGTQANICVHSVGVLSVFCKIHDIVKLHIVKTTLTILSQTIYIAHPYHTHTHTHQLNYALLLMQPHMYTSSHITMKTIHIQYLQLCTTHPLKPPHTLMAVCAYRCFLHSVSLWSLKIKDTCACWKQSIV